MSMQMQIQITDQKPVEAKSDALVVFVGADKDAEFSAAFREVNGKLEGRLGALLNDEQFHGKTGEVLVYHVPADVLPARRLIVAGLGKLEEVDEESLRRASAAAVLSARNAACSRVTIAAPAELKLDAGRVLEAVLEGATLSTYRYLKFKTREEEIEPKKKVDSLTVLAPSGGSSGEGREALLEKIRTYSDATFFCRDLVNEPANALNPKVFADIAASVAKESGLEYRVLEADELEKLGAGSILGVGKGSQVPPRIIQLHYSCGRPNAPKIALVGKGITFDSGGLSLKPSKHMETMKSDMAGAAAVLATLRALPKTRPSCDVYGIICAAENMPSGSATRPGDVLKAMNGKSIEVINTDAEGRLVLADGLSWAVKQGVEQIVDLATLTGACIIGLGPYIAGAMGNDPELLKQIREAGAGVGERYWELPIPEDYDFMIKSDIADIKNLAANSEAGAIQGALFLREFVDDTKWVHLDIAGPSWLEKDFYYIPKNATGFGVRTLLEFLSRF